MIFGILTVVLGCLAGLMVIMLLVQTVVMAPQTHMSFVTILPAISIYVVVSAALIWLGIGSILARRWARALLLIFSWTWMVMGIFAVIGMAFVMPHVMKNLAVNAKGSQPAMPDAAIYAVVAVMLIFLSVFFIILPAIWVFFYGSRHVKATCEARDGVRRWTDSCPLPVLAMSLWLLFGVPMFVIMAVTEQSVLPFFGTLIGGIPGALLCLALAALWSYAAWLIYQLKPEGWWLILIASILIMISSCITFARHDAIEIYQLMNLPQAQIDQIQNSGLAEDIKWFASFGAVPFLVYLLFIKKYFRAPTVR